MATQVDFRLDQAALNRMIRSPNGEVGTHLRKLGTRTAARSRELAPRKTGNLRKNISMKQGPLGSVEVTAETPYAYVVHEGSAPHVIQGKPTLKFPSKRRGGQVIVVKKVNHPGHRAQPFLMRALREIIRS